MCTALVISGRNFSLAAADTLHAINGARDSYTGRTRRILGGWCSTSGDAAVVLRGLRELEAAGVANAAQAVEKAVRECAEQCPPVSPSRFLIAADTGELLDLVTGRPIERVPAPASGMSYVVQPPPGLADDDQHATQAMLAALNAAKTIEAVVRAVAGFVRDTRAQGARVSDQVEIGLTFGGRARYCHQPAGVLARATDGAIDRVFSVPPVPPPFPKLESERLIFSLPIEV